MRSGDLITLPTERMVIGAVGKYGSIAVIERFIRTLKSECTRRIVVPLRRRNMRTELTCHLDWYSEHRPHDALDGRTLNEVYFDRPATSEAPWPFPIFVPGVTISESFNSELDVDADANLDGTGCKCAGGNIFGRRACRVCKRHV